MLCLSPPLSQCLGIGLSLAGQVMITSIRQPFIAAFAHGFQSDICHGLE